MFALVLPAAPGAVAQSTTRAETLWSSYFGGGQGDQVLAVATDDFGHIVFELIERGEMRKTEHDQLSDFFGVFDFHKAFMDDYSIDTSSVFGK